MCVTAEEFSELALTFVVMLFVLNYIYTYTMSLKTTAVDSGCVSSADSSQNIVPIF